METTTTLTQDKMDEESSTYDSQEHPEGPEGVQEHHLSNGGPGCEQAAIPKDPIGWLQNSVESFFNATSKGKDDPVESPLVKISGVLQGQGISPSHLGEALAVIIGIISPRLGDPAPMVITEDEGAGATQFLATCLTVVPETSWTELPLKGKKTLAQDHLKNETLISYDADSAKGELSEILWMTQRVWNSRELNEKEIQPAEVPASFVAIVRNLNNPLLQNRYVTRIHLTADTTSKTQLLDSMSNDCDWASQNRREIERACVRTFLGRLGECPVSIGYSKKILEQLNVNLQNIVPLYDLILRMIRNITRINNPPPFSPLEPLASFIGVDFREITQSLPADEDNPLSSTRVDFYYFNAIFGSLLQNSNDFMTPRQARVFQAILDHNIARMNKFARAQTQFDMLHNIVNPISNSVLANKITIWEAIKKDGEEQFSSSTLNTEIKELMKRGIIFQGRLPGKRLRYGYGVNQFWRDPLFPMPDPCTIEDASAKEATVKVRHPITGQIETI